MAVNVRTLSIASMAATSAGFGSELNRFGSVFLVSGRFTASDGACQELAENASFARFANSRQFNSPRLVLRPAGEMRSGCSRIESAICVLNDDESTRSQRTLAIIWARFALIFRRG